jgi:hypothetical protein
VYFDQRALFYSLAPLLTTKDVVCHLYFTQSLDYCLCDDRNRYLLIVGFFEEFGIGDNEINSDLMARLRSKYDRIVFFDDSAGAGCTRFEILPYVDLYLKKQLLKDRRRYCQPLYGRQLYTDYYHRSFGVNDTQAYYRKPLDERVPIEKIRLAWNLGVGSFPIMRRPMFLGAALARLGTVRCGFFPFRDPSRFRSKNRGTHGVHARFTVSNDPPSVFFQRKLLSDKVRGNGRFLTGRVGSYRYNREIRNALITLSPFGWGEICYRDFEAVLNESLLLKPSMDHLETWPDIYLPGITYVPISWDCHDIVGKAEALLEDEPRRRDIARAAKQRHYDALSQVSDQARNLISWIMG